MTEHVVSVRIYAAVFAALVFFTLATVYAATVDLGQHWNDVVALVIAVTKASLVVLFFMHLRYSARLTWLVLATGVVWLVILIGFTMSDLLTRGLQLVLGA